MSVKTKYLEIYHETRVVKKIEILGEKRYRVKYINTAGGSDIIVEFNLTSFDGERLNRTTIGHDHVLWRFRNRTVPEVHFSVWGNHDADQPIVNTTVTSYPHYLYLTSGETETAETATATYTPPALTFAQRRARENSGLRDWKDYMESLMAEAARYAFASDDLIQKLGRLLRSMDQLLKDESQNPNIDPLVVARMAETAIEGPNNINSMRAFMRKMGDVEIHATRTQSWVRKGPSNNRENISHRGLANLSLGAANRPKLSTYDALDRSWIKKNRDGWLTLNDTDPTQGTAVTANLTDPDGGVANRTWQWQSRTGDTGTWTDISGATSGTYTPVAGDVGNQLRATLAYTDNINSDTTDKNTVESDATAAVVASG